jgi:hypothetical protein
MLKSTTAKSKLPLEYGPREADILKTLTESQKLPSKNEGFRRGIIAVDYLMDADRKLLFQILSTLLAQASDSLLNETASLSFLEKLEASRTIALEIVATVAAQKGIESADSIDIFRSDLDNYVALAKTKGIKGASTRNELAKRLSVLSELATQFANKENQLKQ